MVSDMYIEEVYGKGNIYAKVVADSKTTRGTRLTTMELQYPRFIHSEFMTHRVFSRNASSSRAIPIHKVLSQVLGAPATPIHWGANQPGMQAHKQLDQPELKKAKDFWLNAADDAGKNADDMAKVGLHKQVVNRILEPFQFIKVIVTATEWDNFFALRRHKDAQPEIQELAECMHQAMARSVPILLVPGGWHVPYCEFNGVLGYVSNGDCNSTLIANLVKASVARCARVSYLTHDNTEPSIEKDCELYDRLLEAGHMSPFEHVAWPMDVQTTWTQVKGVTHMDKKGVLWSGNFRGFIQLRQTL